MEKGWGDDSTASAEALLALEREKTWGLISELVEDVSVFDVFLYGNDYHNLKAAIKEAVKAERTGHDYPGIFIDQGSVDVKLIRDSIQNREFQRRRIRRFCTPRTDSFATSSLTKRPWMRFIMPVNHPAMSS